MKSLPQLGGDVAASFAESEEDDVRANRRAALTAILKNEEDNDHPQVMMT